MPLDPEIAELLTLINAGPPMHEMTPAGARESFRRLCVDYRKPEDLVPVAAVEEDRVAGMHARVYRPEASGPVPTVAFFHGGGFMLGDLDTHDNMARAICRGAEAVVVSVDYRLAPEHRFPAAVEDAVAATREVAQRWAEYGGNDVLAVAGDSAGGNLSAVAAQAVPDVRAQFLIYPSTDAPGDYPSRRENAEGYFLDLATMVWFAKSYVDQEFNEDPRLSPLRGPLAGLPPAVLVTAEFDPLRDEGIAYADALAAAGVQVRQRTYPGMVHGFMDFGPWSTAARNARDDAVSLFAELLAGLS